MTTKPETLVHRANSRDHPQPYGRHLSEHRKKPTKPLNFKQAMDDFQFMFPDIDREVIETVLRANNGVVQSTIDQLLILQESTPDKPGVDKKSNIDFPPIPSYENAIADHHNEPPPAYSAIWKDESSEATSNEDVETAATLSRAESIKQQSLLIANSYWKAPLVGTLSNDFLRIEPVETQVNGLSIDNNEPSPSSSPQNNTLTNEDNSLNEDEKLALFLQNEEFLQELRRNREFVESLESDHRKALQRETGGKSSEEVPSLATTTESVPSGGARPRTTPPPAVQDDQAFKQKLKHMGKSTKKKFSKVAKRFSRGQNGSNRNHLTHSSNSTFSLLNEEDDDIDFDDIREIPEEHDDIDAISEESDDQDKTHRPPTLRQQRKHSGTGRQLPQIGDTVTGRHTASGETGRQLPQLPPGESHLGNTEPIVFYDEDNEFEYKKE